jgi:hypothetical protein
VRSIFNPFQLFPLDNAKAGAQKQCKVFPENFYAHWRAQRGLAPALREDESRPPEKLLQAVWQHQRLLRDQLKTLDGRKARILHPGFLNREGGPDFRGAVVQFGDDSPIAGDVEVDIETSGWHAHGHDRNPNFKNVILHVIWGADRSRCGVPPLGGPEVQSVRGLPPAVAIRGKLDAPLNELSLWLNSDDTESFPEALRGQCSAPLRELVPEKLREVLLQAAQIRFRGKAEHFQARARQAGWEQSLWEGIFRALGYKHNVWPMQHLAEIRDRWFEPRIPPLALQARLLGLAGLLPADITRSRSSADSYLRSIWDLWWREREELSDFVLPREAWRFHGQRPANHPQRRLALAAHWLAADTLPAKVEKWCARKYEDGKMPNALMDILQIGPDDFWSWHWTIRSPRLKKAQPLLGASRVSDLAVNVILPWLWIRAFEGKNPELQREVERRFNDWPASEDNSVLRLARQRLLGGASRRVLRSAAEQQGLIQIVRDFCDHSNAVCENCRFPELVMDWNSFPVGSTARSVT